ARTWTAVAASCAPARLALRNWSICAASARRARSRPDYRTAGRDPAPAATTRMIPADILLLFVAASAALAVAPDPDNLYVLTQAAIHGRKAGILVTLGLCSGLLVHIAAVALGVAAIVRASAPAFAVLKALGAAYLLYLAWQAFRAGTAQLQAGSSAPP